MSDQNQPNLLDLLDELLAMPASEREAKLQALPPESHQQLRRWLAAEGTGPTQLMPSSPAILSEAHKAISDLAAPSMIDQTVGPYRILEQIGEVGMGTVYKAEQRVPVKRLVALKVINLGFNFREVIARFESER